MTTIKKAFDEIFKKLDQTKHEVCGEHTIPAEFVEAERAKNPNATDEEVGKAWVDRELDRIWK